MEQKITIEKDSLQVEVKVKNAEWSNYLQKINNEQEEPAMLDRAFQKLKAEVLPSLYLQALKTKTVYFEDQVYIKKISARLINFFAKFKIFPPVPKHLYQKLPIDFKWKRFRPQEVQMEIRAMLIKHTPAITNPDYKIKRGDWVQVSFEGYFLGSKVPRWNQKMLIFEVGKSGYFQEMDAALVGMKTGDAKTIEKVFAKTHSNSILRNKKAIFKLKIFQILDLNKQPKADDDFARQTGIIEMHSLKQLRAFISYVLKEENHQENLRSFGKKFFARVLPWVDFDIPEELIVQLESRIATESSYKLLGGQFVPQRSEETATSTSDFMAIQKIKSDILLDDIARQHQINISPDEIEDGYKMISKIHNITTNLAKERFKWLDVRKFLLNRKVMGLLAKRKI